MSTEAVQGDRRRADTVSHVTHIVVCGATEAAVEIALMLRRFGEAVTLLAEDVGAQPRQMLERAGVMIVLGPPGRRSTRSRSSVNAVGLRGARHIRLRMDAESLSSMDGPATR